MEKVCKTCGELKPTSDFKKHSETRDKLHGSCKTCCAAKQRVYRATKGTWDAKKYEKTKKGFLVRVYRNMKSRITGVQKMKFHLYQNKEILAKPQFYEWALADKSFHELFAAYQESGYDRKLAPSVDRKDSKIGYVLGNMEFVTHSENSSRGSKSDAKKIRISVFKEGSWVGDYPSLSECGRSLNLEVGSISCCLHGKLKSSGGYTFKQAS